MGRKRYHEELCGCDECTILTLRQSNKTLKRYNDEFKGKLARITAIVSSVQIFVDTPNNLWCVMTDCCKYDDCTGDDCLAFDKIVKIVAVLEGKTDE